MAAPNRSGISPPYRPESRAPRRPCICYFVIVTAGLEAARRGAILPNGERLWFGEGSERRSARQAFEVIEAGGVNIRIRFTV